jgi:hypothetical protein
VKARERSERGRGESEGEVRARERSRRGRGQERGRGQSEGEVRARERSGARERSRRGRGQSEGEVRSEGEVKARERSVKAVHGTVCGMELAPTGLGSEAGIAGDAGESAAESLDTLWSSSSAEARDKGPALIAT